jgi:hypothetical protein
MVRLMFVEKEGRWIDSSLRNLTGDWLRRVEERFAGVNGSGAKASMLQSFSSLDNPHAFVEDFFAKYPASTAQLLASEDKAYFLTISQRRGQKPAPFIPILDANFEVWFKKVCCAIEFLQIDPTRFAFRILFGKPRISKPFSIKILSVSVSSRALLPLGIPRSRTSPSRIYSAISTPLSSTDLSRMSTMAMSARCRPSIIWVQSPKLYPS